MIIFSKFINRSLCFFLGLVIISLPADLLAKKTNNQRYSPSQCIIVFDIDDVLLTLPTSIASFAWNNKSVLAKNIGALWHLRSIKKEGGSGADCVRFCKEHGNNELADALEKFTHSKIPMPGMQERIQKLHKLGYRLDIISNMSKEDFLFYKQKYPTFFACFHGTKLVTYKKGQKALKKPNLEFFREYLTENRSAKKRMFWDDKKENVLAAQKVGFDAFVFENIEQFDKTMSRLCALPCLDG